MTIEYFERDAPSQDVVEALYRDGAAVVRDQLSGDVADAVLAELRPHFDKEGRLTESDFNGYKTLRAEENHFLMVPRQIADSHSEPIRRLLGYQSHGRLIGAFQGDPDEHWRAE